MLSLSHNARAEAWGLTEERGHEEALDLDPLAAEVLDAEDRDVVPGDEAERGDDEVADADLEEALPGGAAAPVEADLLQDDVLVEVDAVETWTVSKKLG